MENRTAQRLARLWKGPVHAVDGDIGTIVDFYFDDDEWTIRYLVVDTGKWLPGRQVLIPLWALHSPDWDQARVPVGLTREQVKNSPDVDLHRPVSREAEIASLRYYGYPSYWGGPALWGAVPTPGMGAALPPTPTPVSIPSEDPRDTHLRSCAEVSGYHLRATDGEIGHIDDFLVDASSWRIGGLLVDTSNWIGGRHVVVSPASVERVSWAERMVFVSLSRDAIAHAETPSRIS